MDITIATAGWEIHSVCLNLLADRFLANRRDSKMSVYQYRSITFMKTLGLCCQRFRVCNHKSTSPASKKNISARTFHFCLRFGFFPRNTAVSEFEHRTRCSFDCSSIGQVSARVWQGPAAAWEFRTAFHQAARWRRQITSDSQWQDFSHSVLPRFSVSLFSSSHFFFFFLVSVFLLLAF